MAILPTDIIFDEILPKLPVKSLLRFKSVSKQFETLISSPNFILHHLRHSLSSNTNRLLITTGESGIHLYDIDSPENPPVRFPVTDHFSPDPNYYINSCCHGLILLHEDPFTSDFMLINPSTGFYTVIPSGGVQGLLYSYGFGYDAINDNYKIVILDDYRIVVANLKDKIWRKVDNFRKDNVPSVGGVCLAAAVYDNHLCHWLHWCELQNKHRIVCFDLLIEKWTQDIPLPNCRNGLPRLQILNEFLSVMTLTLRSRELSCSGFYDSDLWVMKEYGIKESWVKLFRFPDIHSTPLAFDRGSHSKVLCKTFVCKEE